MNVYLLILGWLGFIPAVYNGAILLFDPINEDRKIIFAGAVFWPIFSPMIFAVLTGLSIWFIGIPFRRAFQ